MTIITLLSDFGSFYPAQMKGVILSKLKVEDVTFVDIAHDIPPQDVRAELSPCYPRSLTFLKELFTLR